MLRARIGHQFRWGRGMGAMTLWAGMLESCRSELGGREP